MDSREVFRQFLSGTLKSDDAILKLHKLLEDTSTLQQLQEATKARYVISFIRRYVQYKSDKASSRDLCLNLRDLVLVLGRVKLTEELYRIVKEHGEPYNLVCENELQVSCLMQVPTWLAPRSYVQDVYAMKRKEVTNEEFYSAGDEILRQNTIFSNYKSFEQKLAVHTSLLLPKGHTLLISLPTGGGKSLVTQILSGTTEGLTIVTVPTVALALDQYEAAKRNLQNCSEIYCYRGDQSQDERCAIFKALREKRAKLLFTSPEAIFKNSELYDHLNSAAEEGYLANVVVDEAHVVPDWGVFFRPDFQIFAIALKKWKSVSGNCIRTYLLSATLSDDVVETLFTLFGLEGQNSQVRCDTLRQEPRFYFCSAKSKQEQWDKVIEAMRLLPKPMVIYLLEPKDAVELQKRLIKQEGYRNIPVFTGETKEDERKRVLNGWKQGEFDVVIATSAFGIGVDKPDVRTVIHACCPENLSRYYQEVGRGGRDGLPSISLLIPYQSQNDKDGDVHRALGMVNKRVLTVERSIIRWISMLKSPSAIINGDECILDTSTTPYTMTYEEAEVSGLQNVKWNVNLLLFLHRVGFIDLIDASYVPEKESYSVTVKLLRADILGDAERLTNALVTPRQNEYNTQLEGYRIIRDIISSPKSSCWGHSFKYLFPLSREVCNGCPSDPEGRLTTDTKFKLRTQPNIQLPPSPPSQKLKRHMGTYDELVVQRKSTGSCTLDEVREVTARASQYGIGCFVLPKRFANEVNVVGIVLDYNEFHFAVTNTPYLFAKGVFCVFENEATTDYSLFKNLSKLKDYGYWRVLYCNENTGVSPIGKTIRDVMDGYTISAQKL